MLELAVSEVAGLVGAATWPEGTVTGEVRIDSRAVEPGDLFVALAGERVDGHEFAATAVERGAVAVIVERPTTVRDLVVPDSQRALQDLARGVFGRQQPLTFGITGSSGKTSTKDLLAHVLSAFGDTLAPAGNFNNEIGMPLTATQRTAATRYAVLEYGARGVGHLAFLCSIARPDISIVLNVGSAHLGEFGSVEAIAVAKGELVEAARTRAVLNADDPRVAAMRSRTDVPVVTYGLSKDADVRATDVRLGDDGRASFRVDGEQVALQLVGEHHVSNALAVLAAVRGEVTDDLPRLVAALGEARPASRWRMEVTERPDGVTVVNDAYNANPESMRAALKTLAVMSAGKSRRTWAVLGAMGELGDNASTAHLDLGRFVVRLDVSRLVVIGSAAGGIHAGAVLEGSWGEESVHVDDVDAALALLRAELAPGDVVLVKASRSAGLERVAAGLLAGSP
ncbi:MAG: UDP-N-acetylmuramoyl-tripeptide--D-alanyl-D-alanine ligase [Mycobacteriales bacterium]